MFLLAALAFAFLVMQLDVETAFLIPYLGSGETCLHAPAAWDGHPTWLPHEALEVHLRFEAGFTTLVPQARHCSSLPRFRTFGRRPLHLRPSHFGRNRCLPPHLRGLHSARGSMKTLSAGRLTSRKLMFDRLDVPLRRDAARTVERQKCDGILRVDAGSQVDIRAPTRSPHASCSRMQCMDHQTSKGVDVASERWLPEGNSR